MRKTEHYVGLDVHKDTVMVAVADGGREGEVRLYGQISNDLHAIEKALRKIGSDGGALHVAYEAGPTGYVIYRRLMQLQIECVVVAASKTPVDKAARRKTDRRDAQMLARLHRAGELTAVHVPDAADEAMRDLTRARADAVHDLTRARQRLKSFLLRHGYRYSGKANWSEAHRRYLRELVLPLPGLKAVLEEYLLAISQCEDRVNRLEQLLELQAPLWRLYPAVEALMTLRGVQLVAAAVLVAELGDIRRFTHPRDLMAFLGLVPKEESSGQTRKLGSITKAGNAHARWILVEMVQHAWLPPKVSAHLSKRQEGQPVHRKELAWKVQLRLHSRAWHLSRRGVMKPKITVALAREMAGFVWAMLKTVDWDHMTRCA
ncbi:transposase [Opitutaceae bacterium TAV1]|nr:transposase [Opitutaceae bacterium TAV5]EIQ02005.1 transposase [Opitutaceae bacterium TAV1]AHF89150.1 transposase IS116 [Opitutaceae bacterium TAV5]AHF89300.1 transposase IS116 [Opitutaceae bacterium TAV5]AHF93762.1 transposase IS116 [Opitutaceae bacterium TAV5]